MEIKVIKETKKKIIFELPDKDHSFCNLLKDELLNDKKVSAAAYNINHPLVGKPLFILEADGDVKKVLQDAAKRLQKKISDLDKEFKKVR